MSDSSAPETDAVAPAVDEQPAESAPASVSAGDVVESPESDGKKGSWWTSPKEIVNTVLRLDDTPHRIALGAAIGMFVGWTPTVGVQMMIVWIISVLTWPFFRFNLFAGLVGVYVSNPLTMLPMYWLMYYVGTFFVAGNATYERFADVLVYESFAGWWETIQALFIDIGLPLILGSLVLATIFGVLTYPVMRYLLAKRPHAPEPGEAGSAE